MTPSTETQVVVELHSLVSPSSRSDEPITYNHMVIYEQTEEQVDKLFHALADPTRRDILRRCAISECWITRLAEVVTR